MELGDRHLKVRKASIGITQVAGVEMGVNAMSMLAGTTSTDSEVTRVLQLLNMVTPEELMDNDDYEGEPTFFVPLMPPFSSTSPTVSWPDRDRNPPYVGSVNADPVTLQKSAKMSGMSAKSSARSRSSRSRGRLVGAGNLLVWARSTSNLIAPSRRPRRSGRWQGGNSQTGLWLRHTSQRRTLRWAHGKRGRCRLEEHECMCGTWQRGWMEGRMEERMDEWKGG